ncbi:MAG: choice-of-anchor J domain-containing protein, partial [Muribaculaceae bacterium]|nr:choice-of-anchor J domain-containing protein [Muribaculaceae bacterium]
VFTGRGYGVPYMIVPDEESSSRMTILNIDNDRSNWTYTTEVGGTTAFFTNRDWDNSGDDYLITPPLWLDDVTKMYNISFEVKYHNNNRVEEFYDVWLGTGASEDGIREKRVSPKTRVTSRSYYKVDYDFAIPAAGTYYLGIHYVGDPDQGGIYVRDIRITRTSRSGVEEVSADNALTARAGNGEVILEGNGDAAVYSTDGCLVATAHVDGSAAVGVAPGVYLVRAGEKTFKLLVK